jgi:hypothetical protein
MIDINSLLIVIIILSLLFLDLIFPQKDYVKINDKNYFEKFSQKYIITKLINNNLRKIPATEKNKILIISYDNRKDEKYIQLHNHNVQEYTKKYGHKYVFYNKCNENNYWCKVYMVLDALETNKYDYVIWMDSDTLIKDFDIDINDILNTYSSDIFVGSDNNPKYDLINSGVFMIKNTDIGKQFLRDCINFIPEVCVKKDGSLKGAWAASCYEQGTMNILIADKYSKYTTVLKNKLIFNYNVCSNEVFIMHLYASSPNYRKHCFMSGNPALISKDNDIVK